MNESAVVLALETSSEVCSAALAAGGTVHLRRRVAPREHTRYVLGQIDELFQEAGRTAQNLDAVAFGQGPGSFTGVRIATALAQGLAVAQAVPLRPVSSLAAMAWTAWTEASHSRILVVADARLGQVYWGFYQAGTGGLATLQPEALASPEELQAALASLPDGWQGVGSGWSLPAMQSMREASAAAPDSDARPEAAAILDLALRDMRNGKFADYDEAQPVYLRHPVRT